ncbi:MAG: RNA ligase family protein [Candidatus Heimdallarchaeaceae archaeon]
MSFKKYNSIENHYHEGTIEKWFNMFPELRKVLWVAQEKLDGSNISILIDKYDIILFSRNRKLGLDEDFYGIRTLLGQNEYQDLLKTLKDLSVDNNAVYRIYGEIFGKDIQKRINYGNKKYFRVFDFEIDDRRLSPTELLEFFKLNNLYYYLVPFIKIGYYEQLIRLDVNNMKSRFALEQGIESPIEGIVLKPYNKVYYTRLGQIIYIKYKSDKFKEIAKVKRFKKFNGNPDVKKLNNKFKEYINENRVLSIFSKEGKIEEYKDIGKYIKLILEDAKEDFLKDLTEEERGILNTLSKSDERQVYNVGSKVANLLKMYL